MTNPALSTETLLAHEPFVRAVARGLLADEAGVQDVVQETWLRALRRPPRPGVSLRAWLARVAGNLARDTRRAEGRRAVRERRAARAEALDSVEAGVERLAAQREVVGAVLALEEPYREVVLLRYYQGLDSGEIGRRLGRSAATVRSQLSRAHERLRARLDASFGERSAWAGLLVPLLGARSSGVTAAVGVKLLLVAALVVGPTVLLVARPGRGGAAGVARPPVAPTPAGVVEPAASSTSARAALPVARRETVEGSLASPSRPGDPLEGRSVPELFELAVQVQRAVEAILLTPSAEILAEHADFLAQPDSGICRLLVGDGADSDYRHAVTKRGGGTYYSFATRDHSYNADPDVSLHPGSFSTGFAGIDLGLVLRVGDVALEEIPDRAWPVPHWLSDESRSAWELLWGEITAEDAAHGSALRLRAEELALRSAPASESTYLLRSRKQGGHDHLVAFRVLLRDDFGATLAWRVLHRWPGEERASWHRGEEHLEVPPGPAWLADLSLAELLELLEKIRDRAKGPLFDIPEETRERYERVVDQLATSFVDESGFARILHRSRWDPLVRMRGEGAYYSFLTRSNSYDERPELSLEQGSYSSGFAGHNRGLLLDVGSVPFEYLGSVMGGDPPPDLGGREREAWDFLWNVRATLRETEYGSERALTEADERRAEELGFGRGARVPARVGHTYLLRSVLFPSHDHLVVFTVIDGDDYGHTLAWRILKDWPVEQTR